jgi:uncharacterized protein DUF6894
MKRYFFDLRKDEALAVDEEGTELPSIDAVQEEAVRSLAEMAKQAVPAALKNGGYRMAIEVRNESGPIMKVLFKFEAEGLAAPES